MQKQITAYSEKWDNGAGNQTEVPMGTVCQMVWCMSQDFQEKPQVCQPQNGTELWVSFPGTSIQCDEFMSGYGDCLASLCGIYGLSLCGFSDFLEEGTLAVQRSEDGLYQVRKNVSGKPFDILSAVWLRIDFQRRVEADFVGQVLEAMEIEEQAAAVSSRWADVFTEKGLFSEMGTCYYRYVSFDERGLREKNAVGALKIKAIEELWVRYFQDNEDALEFDLIYEHLFELSEGQLQRIVGGLRLALRKLGIRVDYSDGEFRVLDAEGGRIWLDYSSKNAAQRLFLKLLFPAAPQKLLQCDAAAS